MMGRSEELMKGQEGWKWSEIEVVAVALREGGD